MTGDFKQSELNPGFFKRMKTGLPWVRVKSAKSLDGYIALKSGESKWITGAEARKMGIDGEPDLVVYLPEAKLYVKIIHS